MTKEIQQLKQIATGPVWDGNLISKDARDQLHRYGLVARTHGWNVLTEKGCIYCVHLGILRA